MNSNRQCFRLMWPVAVLALLVVGFPSLALGEPGVTDTEILIGNFSPHSGPAASYGVVAKAAEAYFKWINDQGGIHGRKIRFLIRDDGYNPSKTKLLVKELVERDQVFAINQGLGTPTGQAVYEYLDEMGVPHVAPASGSSLWTRPFRRYLFALETNYVAESSLLARYIVEHLNLTKVAIFYQNDSFGREGLDGATATLEKLGYPPVETVAYEVAETDMSSHALRLRESGAEAVILWSIPKPTSLLIKECEKIGWRPQWVSSTVNADERMFRLVGDAWNGAVTAIWVPLAGSDHPLVDRYRRILATYAPKETFSNFSLVGFANAEVLVEALRRAGRDLTREKLVEALESFDNWNGGLAHNVTYGPDDRQGQNSVKFVRAENGRYVEISDYIEYAGAGQ